MDGDGRSTHQGEEKEGTKVAEKDAEEAAVGVSEEAAEDKAK